MEEGPKITIKKVDDSPPSKTEVALVSQHKQIEGGKKRRTLKTFPRGILKTARIKPVADPAKQPPLKKGSRKHTIRISSDSHRRKTIKKKLSKMSDVKVKELAVKSGLSKGNAPPALLRQMVEGGMISGFISLD